MKKLLIIRRTVQLFFFLTFVYILWSTTYPLKGLLPPETFFKINPLIMIFTSLSEGVVIPGIIFTFLMLLFALLLGRFFCGWICPLGTIMDFVGSLKKRKEKISDITNQRLRRIKFCILGIVFVFAVWGLQIAWVFDPLVISARFISLNFIPTFTFIVDALFIILIKYLNLYGPLLDFYRMLKASILGIKIYYFSHALIIFIFFLLVAGSGWFIRRFWCRLLCPLGALYALLGRVAWLRRALENCSFCGKCKSECRMGAIRDDLSYKQGECILCLDCVYSCPQNSTRFIFANLRKSDGREKALELNRKKGISRREFLLLLIAGILPLGLGIKNRKVRLKRNPIIIRPPAALEEDAFLNRCIRCGNCMKVCPTNGLQPVSFQAGWGGIWTPHLVPEIGYCGYNCTLCADVCPTGAIPKIGLAKKQKIKIGIAKIDRRICLPWEKKKECIVCEEHCPVPDKAIKLKKEMIDNKTVLRPYVDVKLCIGCAVCQTKCPTTPARSIIVFPVRSYRT